MSLETNNKAVLERSLSFPGGRLASEFFFGDFPLIKLIAPSLIEKYDQKRLKRYEEEISWLRETLGGNSRFLDMSPSKINEELSNQKLNENRLIFIPGEMFILILTTEIPGILYKLTASPKPHDSYKNQFLFMTQALVPS